MDANEFLKLHGHFSAEYTNNERFKELATLGYVGGYFGHTAREPWMDTLVEQTFKTRNISPSDAINWLSDSSGRHWLDSYEGSWTPELITKTLHRRLANFTVDVFIRNHPDNTATLMFRCAIIEKLVRLGYIGKRLVKSQTEHDAFGWHYDLFKPLPEYDHFRLTPWELMMLSPSYSRPDKYNRHIIANKFKDGILVTNKSTLKRIRSAVKLVYTEWINLPILDGYLDMGNTPDFAKPRAVEMRRIINTLDIEQVVVGRVKIGSPYQNFFLVTDQKTGVQYLVDYAWYRNEIRMIS